MNAPAERDRLLFELAQTFLLGLSVPGVDEALLEKYMALPSLQGQPETVPGIYRSLLGAARNANMRSNVIGSVVGDGERLGPVLDDFDPAAVVARFGDDWEALLDRIETELMPKAKFRRSPRSIWPLYCRTILSAARFMSQFASVNDFYHWADFFDSDDRARPALPMLIAAEVYGIGFPLACDFLKELGYLNYAKPDVHIRDIFTALNLCRQPVSNHELVKAVVRVARNVERTPYAVDKLFWLVGSGLFYDDPHIGENGRIGRHKQQFIEYVGHQLDWEML